MKCCPECFGDRGLRKDIFPTLSPSHGTCDFCETVDVDLVDPMGLSAYFELLINVYEPSSSGKLLVEWLKEDWGLFSHPKMDMVRSSELLGKILDNDAVVRRLFAFSSAYKSVGLIQWETLRDEMMYHNRWFLSVSIDTDRLEELLSYLLADDLPHVWYRARLIRGDSYPIKEMGAPPNRLTSHGRANPAGIPYLYLSSQQETAVSEIRPYTGELACVARFRIKEPLRAVDLRAPRQLVSPFLLAEASAVGQLRADIPFLERLGDELTRPVQPSGAAIDYIPSQYLCEFIKNCGYDGLIYRSSVSDGINLALFDPAKAIGEAVEAYSVKRVSVDVERILAPS